MHRIAEDGIAAHWKYKEGRTAAQTDEQYFRWLRQLLEWQQEIRDPQEFLQNLKVDLYPEEVYTFTPRGEVKSLPRGATAIDFAYAIHTDVGHQCVGARVNGRMVPLRQRLKNGDIVEIVTQAGHKPSRDWLNFVSTSRARNKIKHFLNAEERPGASISDGSCSSERRGASTSTSGPARGRAAAHRRQRTGVSQGRRPVCGDRLRQGLGTAGAGQARAAGAAPRTTARRAITSVVRRVLGTTEEKIKVRGADDLLVFRARCCNPIRGEKIVGYITRGKGVSVHSASCPNVLNLLYDPSAASTWSGQGRREDGLHRPVVDPRPRPEGHPRRPELEGGRVNTNIKTLEATTDEQEGRST